MNAAIVILGPVLACAVTWLLGQRDRRVEGRASARVIGGTLTSVLIRNYQPKEHPFRPVFIDYGAYAAAWETERKTLARIMTADDYSTVEKAVDELCTVGKMEAAGRDLKEEVFDALSHAAQACEFARRVTWRYSQSPRDRIREWARQARKQWADRREFRKLDRLWQEAREHEKPTS